MLALILLFESMKRIANSFIKKLNAEKLTLALAESITCGLAANKLSSCIGVSDVLTSSIICYTPEAKMQILGVKKATIDKYTCESPEVTKQMAQYLPKLIKADLYAAITGRASADGSETKKKPVGTVFYCVMYLDKIYEFRKVFDGAPLEIKKKAALGLYELILDEVLKVGA